MAGADKTDIKLYHQDCIAGLAERLLPDSVDVVVTSPPYNLDIAYRTYRDRLGWESYFEWMAEWLRAIRRVLKAEGSFFLNLGSSPSTPLLPHQAIDRITRPEIGFVLQNTIHWVKSIAMPDAQGVPVQRGHYKPINSQRYLNDCHEYVFHLSLSGSTPLQRRAIGVPYTYKSNY